jgi:hypothetical protein
MTKIVDFRWHLLRHLPGRLFTATLFSTLILLAAVSSPAKAPVTGASVPVTTTVTVLGPKFTAPPAISKQDVTVYDGKTRLDVTKWISAQDTSAALQLAVLIDNDASELGVGSQLRDIAAFINSQSRNTAVGVFYAMNGTVQVASPFSTDHGAVAKTLRPPLGLRAGSSPSIYLSLSDLVKNHWTSGGPSSAGPSAGRREVLLVSNGVDQLDRGPESPYVREAIDDMQKAGVIVHTIYTGGSLRFDASLHGEYAQSNLEELTNGSGGYGFFEGISTPVSFSPFLEQLNQVLRNQYVLTFMVPGSEKEKGDLREIEVRIEQRNIEVKYPKQMLVPAAPKD